MRVLIVEDEKRIALTLSDLLRTNHYATDIAYDGESGLDNAMTGIYDAIILDVMLPKKNGYEISRALRRSGIDTPILMLTAKAELEDRVTGLTSGADYYLTKPFQPRELLACVYAITRRHNDANDNVISFGDLQLELSTCQLMCNGKSVQLSRKEFEIMEKLIANGRQIVTKETILLSVWGYESDAEDNNVEVYISFLRKKLKRLKSTVNIKTLRMIGYQLES